VAYTAWQRQERPGDFGLPWRRREYGMARDMSRLEELCLKKGLKMTGQRRVIAKVLSESTDHPDVEQVYRRASAIDPRISIATVYRTVRLLEEANILARHDFGDGRARYEQATIEHHDHLIDLDTREVIEFTNEDIEKLQREAARRLGFELVGHRLELYGVPLKGRKAARDKAKDDKP
jgi:Fur family transcriptional regulator, ferric uptake regulator